MDDINYDYTEFNVSEDKQLGLVQRVTMLARAQLELEQAVAALEAQVEETKESLRDVRDNRLPQVMEELGLEEFTTADGIRVKVAEVVRASLPKKDPAPGLKWLEEHGHSALIKRRFTIDFGKEEEAWAKRFAADLKRRKKQLAVQVQWSVHPQTLGAFVRSELERGTDLPLGALGVYAQRQAAVRLK